MEHRASVLEKCRSSFKAEGVRLSIDVDFHKQFNRCQFSVIFFLSFDEQSETKDLVVITEIFQHALCVIFNYFS